MKWSVGDHNLSSAAHLIYHIQSLSQGHLSKPPNVICIDLQLLWRKVRVCLQSLHKNNRLRPCDTIDRRS